MPHVIHLQIRLHLANDEYKPHKILEIKHLPMMFLMQLMKTEMQISLLIQIQYLMMKTKPLVL